MLVRRSRILCARLVMLWSVAGVHMRGQFPPPAELLGVLVASLILDKRCPDLMMIHPAATHGRGHRALKRHGQGQQAYECSSDQQGHVNQFRGART